MSNDNENISQKWSSELCERLLCSQCWRPLNPPQQSSCCGRRFCMECGTQTKNIDFTCPCCLTANPTIMPDRGFLRELEKLKINCPICGDLWVDWYKYLKEHLKTHCTLTCRNCNEKFFFEKQLVDHQRERCKSNVISCPLQFAGCPNEIPRLEMGKHYLEPEHQQCLLSVVKTIWDIQQNLSSKNMVKEQIQRMAIECLPRVELALQQSNSISTESMELSLKKEMIETKISKIRDVLKTCSKDLVSVLEFVANLNKIIADMERDIDEIKVKSVTGTNLLDANDTYTWKVNLLLLLSNELLTTNSDKFQTSEAGYQMGISMSIETNEQSKERFISITIILFPGDYDSILRWPFPYGITLYLLDLTKAQQHIISSIPLSDQMVVFNKPLNNTARTYKIPRICSLEKLAEKGSNYVQDDNIYLRTHINFFSGK